MKRNKRTSKRTLALPDFLSNVEAESVKMTGGRLFLALRRQAYHNFSRATTPNTWVDHSGLKWPNILIFLWCFWIDRGQEALPARKFWNYLVKLNRLQNLIRNVAGWCKKCDLFYDIFRHCDGTVSLWKICAIKPYFTSQCFGIGASLLVPPSKLCLQYFWLHTAEYSRQVWLYSPHHCIMDTLNHMHTLAQKAYCLLHLRRRKLHSYG